MCQRGAVGIEFQILVFVIEYNNMVLLCSNPKRISTCLFRLYEFQSHFFYFNQSVEYSLTVAKFHVKLARIEIACGLIQIAKSAVFAENYEMTHSDAKT